MPCGWQRAISTKELLNAGAASFRMTIVDVVGSETQWIDELAIGRLATGQLAYGRLKSKKYC